MRMTRTTRTQNEDGDKDVDNEGQRDEYCWQSRYVWHKGMNTIIGGKLVLDFHRNL